MTTDCSESDVVPKRFCGLRVLLVESDKTSLDDHAYILSQNSYRVTSTLEVATGLSKILNGESYDCVLIDADTSEMDMVDFLHQTFKHQPQLSIIMMASDNIRMRLFKETLNNEAVLCLPKPCGPKDICNIWQHVCRNKILFRGGEYSNGGSLEENQEPNVFKRVDPMVKQSTTLNPIMINNNLSSNNGTQEGLYTNSLEYGAMIDHHQKQVDETNLMEILRSGTMNNVDKGKQSVEHKTTNDQLVEDESCKKGKHTKTRIKWTGDLHQKFLDAINTLGEQSIVYLTKAYPTTILELMDEPGLTRSQIASHLQKYHEHQKNMKNQTSIPQMQSGYGLQVDGYAHKITGQSTPSDYNYASILPSSIIQPPLKLNSIGVSFMTINNIKARLQKAPPLPVPQPTTTINNSYSDQSTKFCQLFQPSVGETPMITTYDQRNEVQMTGNVYGSATGTLENFETLGMVPVDIGREVVAPVDVINFSNGFVSENCGGANASLTPLDYSGIAIEPWVSGTTASDYGLQTVNELPLEGFQIGGENYNPEMCESSSLFGMTNSGGGVTSASSNHNDLEHLTMPKYVHHSQDFHGNGGNLFPTFPDTTTPDVEQFINLNFSNSDSVPFGGGSFGYNHPGFPGEENNRQEQTLPPFNSIVSDGSEPTVMGSGLSPNVSQWHLEMTVNLLEELDAHLINGPW
ncbi:hypothetical protein L2E82_08430 [Cichorium intybus]|uniref:Uncharacterized protein n=1 Tax=Cichorium intybus TaxID=13427 RepID=A0ACB9G6H0_CICIN|nr:hypothetical protein L2E82_08430 [Cichorium intybus]